MDNQELLKRNVEVLLDKYNSLPVGYGYIDIITDLNHVEEFIDDLSTLNIAVNGVTWWCHSTESNKVEFGCPHGMGGPQSRDGNGWFSEMGNDYECFDLSEEVYNRFEYGRVDKNDILNLNNSVKEYIRHFTNDEKFEYCFHPALWLHVPKEWRRKFN